jgi:hypothetical protein
MGVNGRLFEVVRLHGGGFQLAVIFDPLIITLFKVVGNLLWSNFRVPNAITNMMKDAKRVHPNAVDLTATIQPYGKTPDLAEDNKGIDRCCRASDGMRRNGWFPRVSSSAALVVWCPSHFWEQHGYEHTLGPLSSTNTAFIASMIRIYDGMYLFKIPSVNGEGTSGLRRW